MKRTTVNRVAHSFVNNGKIEARIGELLEEGRKRHDITVSFADVAVTGCIWAGNADGSYRRGSRGHMGVGKATLKRLCASYHRNHGEGHALGPELQGDNGVDQIDFIDGLLRGK